MDLKTNKKLTKDNLIKITASDISEELIELSNTSNEGICIYNVTTGNSYASDLWYNILDSDQNVSAQMLYENNTNISESDRNDINAYVAEVRSGKIATRKSKISITCKNGAVKWLQEVSISKECESGDMIIVSRLTDVTDIEDMRKKKDFAEHSNMQKSAFLANMCHEIRTPLSAIVGFSNLLAETCDENERAEYLEIVQDNNTLLTQLISDVLDISKIESGKITLSPSLVNLNSVMAEIIESARLLQKNKAVSLEFIIPDSECIVHIDKNRFTQVLNNFLSNAMKFTIEGYIKLGYNVEDDCIRFYVSDTGRGISPDQKDKIFSRYLRLSEDTTGTGLGLSISSALVNQMNGRIGVESELDKGSTFWFTLPLSIISSNEIISADPTSPTNCEWTGKKMTILVAEDDASNYHLAETLLKREYNVMHAWTGKEAVEMNTLYSPDIILMDIKMPEMDGYEATSIIRKTCPKIPIIAVTAFAFSDDEDRIMRSGFDGYLSKPIQISNFKEIIFKTLSK